MSRRYDLVAIGGGTAGLVATLTAASLGARTALIESDRIGGDCLWTGCIPSKTLLASAERAQAVRTAIDYGVITTEPEIDLAAVRRRLRRVTEAAGRRDTVEHLRSEGVDVIEAAGRFLGPGRIAAGERQISFRSALICTGSRPSLPAIEGLGECRPLTNETAFDLDRLPERLLVLGGGPVGCELGQAFSRLGSGVTLVEGLERLLPGEEPFAGDLLARTLGEEGVDVRLGAMASGVVPGSDGGGVLQLSSGAEIGFDRILVATGREPVTAGLGLEAVAVETGEQGEIVVDRRLRTSGDRIYAAGDVVGDLRFTHVASYHALVVVANALFGARRRVERDWTPRVTFTDPEIARVGLTEQQARMRHGERVEVYDFDHSELDRALTAGSRGAVKLIAGPRGRLLGATIAGAAAGESISEAAWLIRERKGVKDLSQMIHAYPTFTEGPARAADEYWRRRYFTPRWRRRLRPLLALLRAIDRPRGRRPRSGPSLRRGAGR